MDAAWWPALGDNQGAPDDGEEIDARQDQLLGIVLRHVGDLKAKLFTERLAREIEFQIVLIASEAAG